MFLKTERTLGNVDWVQITTLDDSGETIAVYSRDNEADDLEPENNLQTVPFQEDSELVQVGKLITESNKEVVGLFVEAFKASQESLQSQNAMILERINSLEEQRLDDNERLRQSAIDTQSQTHTDNHLQKMVTDVIGQALPGLASVFMQSRGQTAGPGGNGQSQRILTSPGPDLGRPDMSPVSDLPENDGLEDLGTEPDGPEPSDPEPADFGPKE
jgi:hypothetical protein